METNVLSAKTSGSHRRNPAPFCVQASLASVHIITSMGQLQSIIKSDKDGFEKMPEPCTPQLIKRKIVEDPRSPSSEVCRTPIESTV
uniref:Uncharacterized protein n=1 Tax=Panagrellus redivivus TaxID=6233 RepID=A0A7E4UXA7_PANRE